MAKQAFIQSDILKESVVKFTNRQGVSLSATDGELFALSTASGKIHAAMAYETSTDNSDNGTGIITSLSEGSCLILGAIKVPKSTSVSFILGESVLWDISATQADNATTANTIHDFVLGQCYEEAATADSYVKVILNAGSDAFSKGSSSSSSSSSITPS